MVNNFEMIASKVKKVATQALEKMIAKQTTEHNAICDGCYPSGEVIGKGQCLSCRHQNMDLVTKDSCAACNYGKQQEMAYTCNRCHQNQVIPHPMYRTQKTPTEVSGSTWACHQKCNDFTRWTIVEEHIRNIPIKEIPATWPAELKEAAKEASEPASIKGIRYKCACCPDLDLCEDCEAKGVHTGHPMLKIRDPLQDVSTVHCHIKRRVASFPIMKFALQFLKTQEEAQEEKLPEVPVQIKPKYVEAECEPVLETVVEPKKEEIAVEGTLFTEVEPKEIEAPAEVVEVDPKVEYESNFVSLDEDLATAATEALRTLYEYGFTNFEENLTMLKSVEFSANMAINGLMDMHN